MKYELPSFVTSIKKMLTSWNRCSQLWRTGVVWRTNNHGKMFRGNGLLYDLLEQNGRGRVLVVEAEVLFAAHWSMLNWRVWQYK